MRSSLRPLTPRRPLLVKLALIFLVFFVALGAVRVVSLGRLGHVSAMSDVARNRWLSSVRYLAELNHRISDARSAEAELLLTPQTTGGKVVAPAVAAALAAVQTSVERYTGVPHDADELRALEAFVALWRHHLDDWARIEARLESGQVQDAVALFAGPGRASFKAARDSLYALSLDTERRAEAARDSVADAFADTQQWVSALSFGVLLLFVILAAYVWRSVSRPLLRLTRLMGRLAQNETDFAIPFQRRRDEIGDMARSLAVFRRNTIELLESRKLLADQAGVLSASLGEARALAKEQRNFITTMSHEFRTPLTAIDGNAQRLIARRERADAREVGDRAERIRAAVFRMTSLVASLVNAMEVTQGELRAHTRPFDLRAMLAALAAFYRDIGMGTVEEEFTDLPTELVGDPELLNQAISNLLSNAFKYSREGADVRLTASADGGAVRIIVEDHGIGIPANEISHVRERYYRASNVGSHSGTGMGLHLVDEIIRQHGGQLDIASDEGKGTRVCVTLPIARQANAGEADRGQDLVRRGRSGDSEPALGSAR